MIPLFKKADPLYKTNYRPVSLLSHISKVFERLIYNQINEYVETFLSRLLTGLRKNQNTHSLLKMLENFKEALDKVNTFIECIYTHKHTHTHTHTQTHTQRFSGRC